MSPAPNPLLQAGDDVDADFFDQLGDELDFPAQGAVLPKHQDAGDPPGELGSSGAASLPEVGFPLPQEGNSELEDAFPDLSLETENAESISRDSHLLSNGDDLVEHHSRAEAMQDSEDRVAGVDSSVSDSLISTTGPSDDSSAAQLGIPEDSAASSSVPPETTGAENVESELSFASDLTGTIAEEAERGPLPHDEGEGKLSEASKLQMQSIEVAEVEWSNFGAQVGFGSFSDFLSEYPEHSSQSEDVNAVASEPNSFHLGKQSIPDVGSNVVERQYDDVSFFDVPHPHKEEGTITAAEEPAQPSTTANETQVNSGELPGHLHSQGPEQQVQGDQFDPYQSQNTLSRGQEQQVQSGQVGHSEWNNLQSEEQVQQTQGLWQEFGEYPGWLYNTVTGEWVEKNNSGAPNSATATSWDDASRQDSSQGHGATGNASDENGSKDDPHLGQTTTGTPVTEWTGDQDYGGQTSDTHESLSTEVAGQQNDSFWQGSAGEAASIVSQSGWEDQYPGWYWDHNAQEWKQYSHLPQVAEEKPQSASGPSVSYVQTTHADNFSQGYNGDSTSVPAVSYGQPTPSNNFSQGYNEDSTSVPSVSYGQPTLSKNFSQGYNAESASVPAGSYGQTIPSNNFSQGHNADSASVPAVSYGQPTLSNNFSQGYNAESASIPAVSYGQTLPSNNLSQGYNAEPASVLNVSYGQAIPSNNFSQGYNAEWSTRQGQQCIAEDQYGQDGYGSNNVVPGSVQNDGQSSTQTQITGQWADTQTQQQFGIPPTYYESGHPRMNGASPQPWNTTGYNVQQPWNTGYNAQYVLQTAPKSVEEAVRTSVGRPPHVLTSFAFGGKLLVMKLKEPLSLQFSDGTQSFASGHAFVPGPIEFHSLSQLAVQTSDNGRGETGSSYFGALSRPILNGPLVGGSVSSKELTKWLDEQAFNCMSEELNFRGSGSLPILWGLLKLACKHYGKLRSQSGLAGITSQEEDGAEAALAKLLTSGGDQSSWTMESFSSTVCLQALPSEHQLQVTASETKKLLVAGKRREALKIAQQGQLWGPALVLARQLGEKYYGDTVAAMAQRQFLPGSPLRTLSLLLAGQPAEVFSESNIVNSPRNQPMQVPTSSGNTTEGGIGSMLEEWQENLSIMAANRTNGDDRVISHLGDCLWKVNGEVAAAHICYLVADADFESFSSNARLCLVGADHWKNPRSYVTPEAIQRTEVYEYSKVLGNPQFILVPFQPYKFIYASMLAEAGKTAEALRYCQAVLKTLKTASRAPEVESCRVAAASLEERLRFHMQGGHAANFAPGKLVRGVFSVLDRNIKNIIGGPPQPTGQEHVPMAPSVEPVTLRENLGAGFFGSSPSRPPVSLGPSASAEKLKETGGRPMPIRSVSEPDFSTSMKEKAGQGKPRGGYLGRFGSVFSKAGGIVSMVSKTSKKEAKLGDENKFYFDEKLKRWVEEGADAPQEEAALPPPPTSGNFESKVEDAPSPSSQFRIGLGAVPPTSSATKNTHLGTPPVPPSNQYSARARQQGVRSRYVDTFNKGGNSTTPSKPAVSAFAPAGQFGGSPLQPRIFFVPGSSMDSMNNSSENGTSLGNSEESHTDLHHSESGPSNIQERYQSGSGMPVVPSSENASAFGPGVIRRVPSYENTIAFGATASPQRGGGRLARSPSNGDIGFSNGYHSRANSWSGYPSDFQTSQTETNSSYVNPAANLSMYNGFSSQSTVNTPPTVGSYFPSPAKRDIYNPISSIGLSESFSSPPSMTPSMTPLMMPSIMGGEARPGAGEASGGNEADVTPLVGDDLQELEF